jgi:hypothetical protein
VLTTQQSDSGGTKQTNTGSREWTQQYENKHGNAQKIMIQARCIETAHMPHATHAYMNFLNVFLSFGASAMLCVLLGRKRNNAAQNVIPLP